MWKSNLLFLFSILLFVNVYSQSNKNVIHHSQKKPFIADQIIAGSDYDDMNLYPSHSPHVFKSAQLENKIAETLSQWYENGQWFFTGSKNYKEYDESGNLISYLAHNEAPDWMSNWYLTYEYNADGTLKSSIQYGWDENGLRNESIQLLYTYDASDNLVERLQRRYFLDQWQDYTRWVYTYNDTLLTQVLVEYYDGSSWTTQNRTSYTYESGFLVESLDEYYDPVSNEWMGSYRVLYTNDTDGRAITYIRQNYNSGMNEWQNNIKREYTYDLSGNRIETVTYSYNSMTDFWIPSQKTTDVYENNFVITSIDYLYSGNDWIEFTKSETIIHDDPVVQLVLNLNNMKLIPGSSVYLDWYARKVETINIEFSSDNGITWQILASNQPVESQYLWNVPAAEQNNCFLRISDGSNENEYSQNFYPIKIARASLEFLTHNTGVVNFSSLSDGHLGFNPDYSIGDGFSFNNYSNALYTGGILIGSEELQAATGMVPSLGLEETVNVSPMYDFTSNDTFDQITQCQVRSSGYNPDLEMLITEKTLSRQGDAFVFIHYVVKNDLGKNISGFYIGINADWDIGNFSENTGGYDKERGLVYQYEARRSQDPNFYGIMSLNNFSNCNISGPEYITGEVHQDMFKLMTEDIVTPNEGVTGDYRSYVGSGPYDIVAGKSINAGFVILAGENLESLIANADLAQSLWDSGIVGIHDEEPFKLTYKLEHNYPNPFNPATKISYRIAEPGHVQLIIYDLLGREITTLVNQTQNAGSYTVNFDASAAGYEISSGVYFCILKAGSFVQSRKMLLVK